MIDLDLTARNAGGPITGAAMSTKVRIAAATPDTREAAIALADIVASVDRDFLPGVSSGAVSARAWFARKDPFRSVVAIEPGGDVVGHAGLRINGQLPDGTMLDRPASWEVGMVFVRPGFRGCDIATHLVLHLAGEVRADSLWASIRRGGPGEKVAHSAGWRRTSDTFAWPDGPTPGSVWVPSAACNRGRAPLTKVA